MDRCFFHYKAGCNLVDSKDCEEPAHYEGWDYDKLRIAMVALEALVMYKDTREYLAAKYPGLVRQVEDVIKGIKDGS